MRRQAVVRQLGQFFAERETGDAAAIYLFGSVARGDERPGSDVDLGILYRRDPPPTLDGLPLRLEGELERLLGRAVQVVTLKPRPPTSAPASCATACCSSTATPPSASASRCGRATSVSTFSRFSGSTGGWARRPNDRSGPRRQRLAVIDTCVRELRELARTDAIRADVREQRFVEHTLQLAPCWTLCASRNSSRPSPASDATAGVLHIHRLGPARQVEVRLIARRCELVAWT